MKHATMKLHDHINRLRLARGLTQEAAARKAGISNSAWSHIEQGGKSPRIETLAKIAKALNTTAGKILAHTEDCT